MSKELQEFIGQHIVSLEPILKAANLAYWNFTTTGKNEYEVEFTRLQVALRKMYADRDRFKGHPASRESFNHAEVSRQGERHGGHEMD